MRASAAAAAVFLAVCIAVPAGAEAKRRAYCEGKRATIALDREKRRAVGTNHRDVIHGTPGDDRMDGRRENDRLCGNGGRDRLRGGAHDDRIRSGKGADRANGGHGKDRIWGGRGADRLSGGRGRDEATGGAGQDRIFGGAHRDKIDAVDGSRDRVWAGKGSDRILARDGVRDVIDCGPGHDTAAVDRVDEVHRCDRFKLGGGQRDFALPSWGDAVWSDPGHYETIQTGDLDGDGDAELVGRNSIGIEAHDFDHSEPGYDGSGQWLSLGLLSGANAPSDAENWDNPQYYSTMQTADLDGDGADEVFIRGSYGLSVWKFNAQSGEWETMPGLNTDFRDDAGWGGNPSLYGTIQAADLDGDGAEEVFGRADSGLVVWKFEQGSGWTRLAVNGPYPDWWNFTDPTQYETIEAADLDGDGAHEVYGRDGNGLVVFSFDPGKGTFGGWDRLAWAGPFPNSYGWAGSPSLYGTIQPADVDGDGADEVIARASNGLGVWKFNRANGGQGTGWTRIAVGGPFDNKSGWGGNPSLWGTIQPADLDGDGADEVIGRADPGVVAYKYNPGDEGPDSGSWTQMPIEGDFSDANGWTQARYYSTIQVADVDGSVDPSGKEELLGRWLTGVQTYSYDPAANAWQSTSAAFPEFTGQEAAAYAAINSDIAGRDNPNFDLRSSYPTADFGQLDQWLRDVQSATRPPDIPADVFEAVQKQLESELENGKLVVDWYDQYLQNFTEVLFTAELMDDSADVLGFDSSSRAELEANELEIFEGILEGLNAFDAAPVIDEAAVVLNSVLDGAVSAGFGVAGMNNAGDGFEGAYEQVKQRLQTDFTTAIDGKEAAKQAILSDYGLLSAVGGMRSSGLPAWSELPAPDAAQAIAGAQRNYAVSVWQTITPALWIAYRMPSWVKSIGYLCTKGECDWQSPDGDLWELAYPPGSFAPDCQTDSIQASSGPCQPVSSSLRQRLFDPTSQACLSQWSAGCNLGVPKPDVFLGRNGWRNLPLRTCGNDDGSLFCPRTR